MYRPPPAGWPRLSSSLVYRDPARAIEWLCAAFGFEKRLVVPDDEGGIAHSQLTFGEAVVMVSGEGGWQSAPERAFKQSPASLGGANTQSLMVYVDDVAAHFARARAAGATIVRELQVEDYGPDHWADEGYGCLDPEGHTWYFAQRIRTRGEPG
jgi:uncharacterized glyoxalase superfamily protein PhnB